MQRSFGHTLSHDAPYYQTASNLPRAALYPRNILIPPKEASPAAVSPPQGPVPAT